VLRTILWAYLLSFVGYVMTVCNELPCAACLMILSSEVGSKQWLEMSFQKKIIVAGIELL